MDWSLLSPIKLPDGRTFNLSNWQVMRGSDDLLWMAVLDVQEWPGEKYFEFRFAFYRSFFENSGIDANDESVMAWTARRNVIAHMTPHRHARGWSRCDLPVHVECR